MHIEDPHSERTPDLISKIRALREQAEKQMNQFTHVDDYDVRRVIGKKPKTEISQQPPASSSKKKQGKKTEQTSIDFASALSEQLANNGDEA